MPSPDPSPAVRRATTTRIRRAVFRALVCAPLLVVLGGAGLMGLGIYEVRRVEPTDICGQVKLQLDRKAGSVLPIPSNEERPRIARLARLSRARPLVYVLGASSVIRTDGGVFSEYLERRLRRRLPAAAVLNFGYSGIDSFTLRRRLDQALELRRPDLVVLYAGHNDYNNVYATIVKPAFQRFNPLLELHKRITDPHAGHNVVVHARIFNPRILEVLQRVGLLTVDPRLSCVDELALDRFERNLAAIMDRLRRTAVPLLLVTPVGNLTARPYGDLRQVTEPYERGMRQPNMCAAYPLLKRAQDAERFTYDSRAKTPLLAHLRAIRRPGVHVLDVDHALRQRGCPFSHALFLDYFHFKDEGHRLIAALLDAHLRAHPTLLGPTP